MAWLLNTLQCITLWAHDIRLFRWQCVDKDECEYLTVNWCNWQKLTKETRPKTQHKLQFHLTKECTSVVDQQSSHMGSSTTDNTNSFDDKSTTTLLHQVVSKWSQTAISIKSTVFWGTMLCSLSKVNRCFGGRFHHHLQVRISGGLPPAFMLESCSAYSTPKMDVICPSKMSVDFQQITQHYILEDSTLHNYSCENLKFYTVTPITSPVTLLAKDGIWHPL
jgi:hypothetical protein